MRSLSLTILIMFFSALGSHAQVSNFATIDKNTYDLYKIEKWDLLIDQVNHAIKIGYDYYYLRMRIGIAYFEKEQYRSAIPHFKKALTFSKNPIAAEYLYYAYKLSGRQMDANLVYSKYKDQLISKDVQNPLSFFTGFYSELGLKTLSPSNSEYGSLFNTHIGVEQQLGSRINLYQGYTRISQNFYSYETLSGFGGRYFINKSTFKYSQNEYYLRATIPVTNGLQLTGGLHTQAISDSVSYNNLSYWLGIKANLKSIDFNLSYGKSIIESSHHDQYTGDLIIYPSKNLNMYLRSMLTYHLANDISNTIFYQKIGLRTGENTWFEFYGSFGNMQNVQELEGFYIYNLKNYMNKRLGFSIIFLIKEKSKLIFGYTNESFEEIDTGLPFNQNYFFTGFNLKLKN
ncbi:MAG: hypothetical protein ABFS32_12460 [Bacteroidota bacterium]